MNKTEPWQLEAGDEVFHTMHDGQYCIQKIKRVTKTLIILEHIVPTGITVERRFCRDTGQLSGAGGWSRESIRFPTLELREKVKVAQLQNSVRRLLECAGLTIPTEAQRLEEWCDVLGKLVKTSDKKGEGK